MASSELHQQASTPRPEPARVGNGITESVKIIPASDTSARIMRIERVSADGHRSVTNVHLLAELMRE